MFFSRIKIKKIVRISRLDMILILTYSKKKHTHKTKLNTRISTDNYSCSFQIVSDKKKCSEICFIKEGSNQLND